MIAGWITSNTEAAIGAGTAEMDAEPGSNRQQARLTGHSLDQEGSKSQTHARVLP